MIKLKPKKRTSKDKLMLTMLLETVTGGITSGVTAVKVKMQETESVQIDSKQNFKQSSHHTKKFKANSFTSTDLLLLPRLSNLRLMASGTTLRT